MAKTEQNCCVLTLPLLTEPWQEHIIETRFRIMEQLKNALIAKELRKLENLKRTREWKRLMKAIRDTKDEKEKNKLFKKRTALLRNSGFSEYEFMNDITPMQKHYIEHISNKVAHRSASDVWRAFEKYLKYLPSNGRSVRFHRRGSLDSIANKYPRGDGMSIDGSIFTWKGGRCENNITLKVRIQHPSTDYESEMMQKSLRNMRVVRKWMKTRYKYYLQVTLQGDPVLKHRPIGKDRVGIDIGTQTIAWSSPTEVRLAELAAGIKRNQAEKTALQRKMDRSRRALNPQYFNEDGTIKRLPKGQRRKWVESKHYLRMKGRVRELERKNADIRKHEHSVMANHILSLGNEIFIEDMRWTDYTRRAKETKKDKNGRYVRKKRFGKSIANRAPGMFMLILQQKCKTAGAIYSEVDKKSFKASQYDHFTDSFRKKPLSKRWNHLDGTDNIQRDLYSAFLLMNSKPSLSETDRENCLKTYSNFKTLHDHEIERLRNEDRKHLGSMGIS